ncbi:MAG: 6-phosphogluconolactonase [Rhodomicrobium sp.]
MTAGFDKQLCVLPFGHRGSFQAKMCGWNGAHRGADRRQCPPRHAAAAQYVRSLASVAGAPPVLDLVHLGLGPDGHAASLVPGDPVLEIASADVAVTAPYQGRRRMTLTYPILNRARRLLWLVTGFEKAGMPGRLRGAGKSIPAGRLRQYTALILAGREAAEQPSVRERPERHHAVQS